MERTEQSVVVGVDGSDSSAHAALWAVGEAVRLAVPLRLLLVNNDPIREAHAEAVVRDIANTCQRQADELEIAEEVGHGQPAEELVRRSTSAPLVVVGSRGQGAFRATLLGSTSAAVAAHSTCPTVVVPGTAPPASGPVVVGVDGSSGSRAAIRFAFEAASHRHVELVAVQALSTAYFIPGPYDHPDRDELLASAERELDAQVSTWSGDFPNVRSSRYVSNVPPVQALSEAARQAQLLVVGRRGEGGFTGLLQGSVSRGVLHHPPCPVAVVPG